MTALRRLAAPALSLALALLTALPATGARAAEFDKAQTKEVEQIVRDYLLRHPEVLIEALQVLETRQVAASEAKLRAAIEEKRAAIFSNPDDVVYGNPKGDVTVVEFFDYTCGHCKRSFQPVMDFVDADGNIRLILKEFPILGPNALVASKAAIAARKQDRYVEMHRALFTHKGPLDEASVMKIAADNGLDTAKLKKDMADPAIADMVSRQYNLAEALGIDGTPAFIIGGELLPGAMDKERLSEAVAAARSGG